MNVEFLIEHNGTLFSPPLEGGITWSTDRKGSPGQLDFTVIKGNSTDSGEYADLDFTEGDCVRLAVDGVNVFYGYVFTKKRTKQDTISVTAYDQLRYFKNKDTIVYEDKTASEFVRMIVDDYFKIDKSDVYSTLNVGELEDTGFKIESRVEEDTTLFDMVQTALDLTLTNTGKMFVLYDDCGKISLKDIENMKVDVLIDEETAEDFSYSSSIDSNTYNKIKLTYDNEETGTREVYIAQHGENMNQWGILQHLETLEEGEDGQAKADALLSLYNQKTRNLSINNAFGDIRVRGGSLIPVILNLGDLVLQNYMLVEKCKHEFKDGLHLMSLNLRGGEFIA